MSAVSGQAVGDSSPAAANNRPGQLRLPGWLQTTRGPVTAGLIVLALWLLLSAIEPDYVFPRLNTVLASIVAFGQSGQLWTASLVTARAVVLGSLAAFAFGVLYGFIMHRYRQTFGPLLNFLQTIPPIVYALMAIVWFGINIGSVIFVVFIVGFPIVVLNTAEGLSAVDRQLLEMADACQAPRLLVAREIMFPSLTPYLLSAARIMISFSWRFAILGEIFAGGSGIGYKLNFAYQQSQMSQLFAWTLWLVVLMWISEYAIMRPIEKALTRWRK